MPPVCCAAWRSLRTPSFVQLTRSFCTCSPISWRSEGGLAVFSEAISASVFASHVAMSRMFAFSCCKLCFLLSLLCSSWVWISSHLSKAPGGQTAASQRKRMQISRPLIGGRVDESLWQCPSAGSGLGEWRVGNPTEVARMCCGLRSSSSVHAADGDSLVFRCDYCVTAQ